ncbi:MAG: hypothetical protein AB7O67_16495 [Vicinamibacterales bacterium]
MDVMTDGVSLGEVYRRLCDIDDRHGKQLADLVDGQRVANTRTNKLEERAARMEERLNAHDREFKSFRDRLGEIITAAKMKAEEATSRVVTKDDDAITLRFPTSPKALVAIFGALALFLLALLKGGAL